VVNVITGKNRRVTMFHNQKFDLKGHIRGGAGIEFLEAEVSAKYDLPFAIIWYIQPLCD
jgi:hypothetical protein